MKSGEFDQAKRVRNKIIAAQVINGMTYKECADLHGITVERARQIVMKLCRSAWRNNMDKWPFEVYVVHIQDLRSNAAVILPLIDAL